MGSKDDRKWQGSRLVGVYALVKLDVLVTRSGRVALDLLE